MADLSHPTNPFADADQHLARLLAPDVEEPWFRSLYRNIRELINPPKLPPLEVTSKPVAVKDIWGLYGRDKRSWMMSTGGQAIVVAVVMVAFTTPAVQKKAKEVATVFLPLDMTPPPQAMPKKDMMHGGGGGGDRSPL